jgi:hypothetical protein
VTRWSGGEPALRLVEYNVIGHLSPR